MKDYYTVKQISEMLGVPYRTLQYTLSKRNTWRAFLERNGYTGKSKERFLQIFENNRELSKEKHARALKIRESKRYGKYCSACTDSENVIARKRKEEELRQIEERISVLEDEMMAVVFDRDINSKLQALYIKRRCVREWLGIKDNGIVEEFYL